MGKIKILLLYDFFDPAYKAGGPIQSCKNLVNFLHNKFDFYIYTQNIDLDGEELDVESNQWESYNDIAKVYYVSLENKNKNTLKHIYYDVKPDIVYINGIFTPHFIIDILRVILNNQRVIIVPRGMLQLSALKIKGLKKRVYLMLLKALLKNKNVLWQATNLNEINEIKRFKKDAQIKLAENIPYFEAKKEYTPILKGKEVRFVTIALIAPMKNHIQFIRGLKKFENELYNISYDIYGPVKDQYYFEELKREIRILPKHIQINIHSSISPDRIPAILEKSHFFVLPSLGENFGHAIFEAMQAYTPVIISDRTPWRNLEQKQAGWDLDLKEEIWEETIKKAIEMDQTSYDDLCLGSRKVAEEFMINAKFKEKYNELFSNLFM